MKLLIVSDIHFHPWSQFSTVLKSGINSRLQIVIDELLRAAKQLVSEGGEYMVISGDVFHSRGSLDPEVLNPVRDCIENIVEMGVKIYIIPGNHDLKSNETVALSSSVQNLSQSDALSEGGVSIINEPCILNIADAYLGFVPWRSKNQALQGDLSKLALLPFAEEAHVFIHAGIDGVLSGIPSGNLTPQSLSAHGFKGIYAGHYHNHKDMSAGLPNRVVSVGATTQHGWGDVDTRAGFLILDTNSNSVVFHDTQAPKFVDISGMSEVDMELESAGNYARYRGPQMTQQQINEFRNELRDWGALGVSIEVPRATVAARTSRSATGLTLEESVDKFVNEMKDIPSHLDKVEILSRAQDVLNRTRSVTEES